MHSLSYAFEATFPAIALYNMVCNAAFNALCNALYNGAQETCCWTHSLGMTP